jgi:hypothetical protein
MIDTEQRWLMRRQTIAKALGVLGWLGWRRKKKAALVA